MIHESQDSTRRRLAFPPLPLMMSVSIPEDIGDRTTPKLFGMFFNYGLMGALIVQVCEDPKPSMALVYTLFLLEVVQTGMMSFYAILEHTSVIHSHSRPTEVDIVVHSHSRARLSILL
ncbi:hypothetical protein FB45DRAFT_1064282 [Roridomyces roridus]|uniref:Uncharacterized protein n=1 Tax=Roridomyces roridus TaxID=1738132 RepID=A0AAD7BB25_9AGAR|nr:hypothetical protein FB45DRAFT_1064282 [Roridomyces roridus]